MEDQKPVFLFDIDGVLIQPGGYRESVEATLHSIYPQEETRPILPNHEIQAEFEAHQITSEWDMVAISTSLVANQICLSNPKIVIPTTLQALSNLSLQGPLNSIDYSFYLSKLSSNHKRILPSEKLHKLVLAGHFGESFSQIVQNSWIFENLVHTRDISKSITTKLFQNYCLGSQLFETNYGLQSLIQTESLLEKSDKPLISAQIAKLLTELENQSLLRISVMTARPSSWHDAASLSYSPEAELALKVARMPNIPIIGLGQLEQFASEKSITTSVLLKPSPFHALAALFRAFKIDSTESLELAWEIINNKKPKPALYNLMNNISCVIFEDTAGGIKSLQVAVEMLLEMGIQISPKYYGIRTTNSKTRALRACGAEVSPTSELAIYQALQIYNLT